MTAVDALTWHPVGSAEDAADGALQRVEVAGRAVCLGRDGRRLGRLRRHVHARGVLARRRRAGRRRGRLPVPRLRVRRPHRGRALPARARAAPDLRGPGGGGHRARPAAASGGRRGRRARARGPRARDGRPAGDRRRPATDGPRARRRRPDRPRRLGAGRSARLAGAAAARGAALLAAGDRRSRLLGVHALRRHRRGVEGLADVQLRARRDVAPGSDPGGGRGAKVDARHRPARAHAPARDRQQGLHAARRQHLRGAHPRLSRAGSSRRRSSGRSSTSSRTSPPRSRCGSSRRSWACPSTTESS